MIDWQPSISEIEKLLAENTLHEYATDDIVWQDTINALEKQWKRALLKSKLTRWLRGPIKSVANVKGSYTQVWNLDMYPGSEIINSTEQELIWRKQGYKVRGWVEKRIHLLLFLRVFEQLQPRRILEVGCGNGGMSMMLATMYPDAEYQGIELTDAGVNAAQVIQKKDALPVGMQQFLPAVMKSPQAFKEVDFNVGNATKLPMADNSVDLIFTSLALEQMNQVRHDALREIARVSAGHAVMLEPFPDFNQSRLQKLYTEAKDYFCVNVSQLTDYGLQPEIVFGDFPAKITRGTGLVVASC